MNNSLRNQEQDIVRLLAGLKAYDVNLPQDALASHRSAFLNNASAMKAQMKGTEGHGGMSHFETLLVQSQIIIAVILSIAIGATAYVYRDRLIEIYKSISMSQSEVTQLPPYPQLFMGYTPTYLPTVTPPPTFTELPANEPTPASITIQQLDQPSATDTPGIATSDNHDNGKHLGQTLTPNP
jgi:hypothetical protein